MKKVGIAYIWRGKKEKGTDNHFYAGATHQDLDRRLTFPTQNNELFTDKEDIELIHAEVFSDKEKALQCEAAFIFFLKTLMRYHVIDCVNKNHNKYAYYLTKPIEYEKGLVLCNKIMGQFKTIVHKIKQMSLTDKEQLKTDIGLQ